MFTALILPLWLLLILVNDVLLEHADPLTLHWDYQRYGPDTWQYTFNACKGKSQSPINIRKSLVKYDPHLRPLVLNGFAINVSGSTWNFTHNGHTIVAYPQTSTQFSISGANLTENFYLVQFHFHWGYNAYQGSEHTIDGAKYPLEVHFVYRSQSSGSLAVLSILFSLQHNDNPYINDLLSILNQTSSESMSVQKQMDVSVLMPEITQPLFYRYEGSLTTPPCTEGITWIVFALTVPISTSQLEVFSSNSIPFNVRDPQKLNSRLISANFRVETHETVSDEDEHVVYHCSGCIQTKPLNFLMLSLVVCALL